MQAFSVSCMRMYFFSLILSNAHMKTIDEIHRANLKALAEEFDGVGKLADLIGRQSSQVSQWMNGSRNSGTSKPRGMGTSSCRLVEKACGKPKGWMDVDHGAAANDTVGAPGAAPSGQYQWISIEEAELLTLFRTTDERGRGSIIIAAQGTPRVLTHTALQRN